MSKFIPLDIDTENDRIGKNINKLRLKADKTQLDMAYELQTSSANISLIENGKRPNLNLSTLIKYANYFEVPLSTIIA